MFVHVFRGAQRRGERGAQSLVTAAKQAGAESSVVRRGRRPAALGPGRPPLPGALQTLQRPQGPAQVGGTGGKEGGQEGAGGKRTL